jgi:heme exporter protein B
MGIYSLLVLVVFGVTLAQVAAKTDIVQISGGLIWALLVFSSLLGLNRSFAHEKEEAALEGLLLAPMDRSVIYLAKVTANLLFLAVVELIVLPLFYVFFLSGSALPAALPLVVWPLLAGTIGIAAVGTLLATITINTRGRDVLLALLFIPLAFPLLYACVSATVAVLAGAGAADAAAASVGIALGTGSAGAADAAAVAASASAAAPAASMDAYAPALALAFGYDVVMLLVSWLLYDYVVSA